MIVNDPLGFSVIAVPIPERAEQTTLSTDSAEMFVDIFVEALTPSLNLFILSTPPREVMHMVMEGLAASQISFFISTTMFATGGEIPEWVKDDELMRTFTEMLITALWARATLLAQRLNAERT